MKLHHLPIWIFFPTRRSRARQLSPRAFKFWHRVINSLARVDRAIDRLALWLTA